MKTAGFIAALALALALAAAPAAPAAARTETMRTSTEPARGAAQTVYQDQPTTAKQVAPQVAADATDVNRGARGAGVATGFVAAGVGLAILGLFVRKRGRRGDDEGGRPWGSGPDERL